MHENILLSLLLLSETYDQVNMLALIYQASCAIIEGSKPLIKDRNFNH